MGKTVPSPVSGFDAYNFMALMVIARGRKETTEVLRMYIEELKEKIGIKKSIHEYGIDEKYFMDTLDDMVEQAFNDQCTAANPRYPLMKEIKELYLKCW